MNSCKQSLCTTPLATLSPNVKTDLSNWETTELQNRLSAVHEEIQRTILGDNSVSGTANSDPGTAQKSLMSENKEALMPPPDSGGYVVDEISKEERYRRMQQAAKQRVMTQCRQKGRGGGGALSISVRRVTRDCSNGTRRKPVLSAVNKTLSIDRPILGLQSGNNNNTIIGDVGTPRLRRGPFGREGRVMSEPRPLKYVEIHSVKVGKDFPTEERVSTDDHKGNDDFIHYDTVVEEEERRTSLSGRHGEYGKKEAPISFQVASVGVPHDARVKPIARRLSLGKDSDNVERQQQQGAIHSVVEDRNRSTAKKATPYSNASYSEIYSQRRENTRALATPIRAKGRGGRGASTPHTAPQCGDIYTRARERRRVFENKIIEARSWKIAEEMKECTFSPRVISRRAPPLRPTRSASVPRNVDSVYRRTQAWKDVKEKDLESNRQRREEAKDFDDRQHLVHRSVHSRVIGMPYSTVEASRFYERNVEWKRAVDRRSEKLRHQQQQHQTSNRGRSKLRDYVGSLHESVSAYNGPTTPRTPETPRGVNMLRTPLTPYRAAGPPASVILRSRYDYDDVMSHLSCLRRQLHGYI